MMIQESNKIKSSLPSGVEFDDSSSSTAEQRKSQTLIIERALDVGHFQRRGKSQFLDC